MSGDIGPVGDDRLFFGVDDEDEDADVLAEEVSEGGSGEATLGGVDLGEERGEANIGIPSLKMGAEVPIDSLISFDRNQGKGGCTHFSVLAPGEGRMVGRPPPNCPNDSLGELEFGPEK